MIAIIVVIVVVLAGLIGGFILGVYAERFRGVPLWHREDRWSIGIYVGNSPFSFAPAPNVANPVLTASDVVDPDTRASFVADPFMIRDDSTWYMFFEVMDSRTYKGRIGLASSGDGVGWRYEGIVLREPHHLSYPYVFSWNGEYYMMPESAEARAVRLYRGETFPTVWTGVGVLLHGDYVDPSVVRYQERWWLFVANQSAPDTLRLFFSEDLKGPWVEHPRSPVVIQDRRQARPGGRVLVRDGRVIRYAQDGVSRYGSQLRAFEILRLTETEYREREVAGSPILTAAGASWSAAGIHHIDPHELGEGRWMACVDGCRERVAFRFRY